MYFSYFFHTSFIWSVISTSCHTSSCPPTILPSPPSPSTQDAPWHLPQSFTHCGDPCLLERGLSWYVNRTSFSNAYLAEKSLILRLTSTCRRQTHVLFYLEKQSPFVFALVQRMGSLELILDTRFGFSRERLRSRALTEGQQITLCGCFCALCVRRRVGNSSPLTDIKNWHPAVVEPWVVEGTYTWITLQYVRSNVLPPTQTQINIRKQKAFSKGVN